jgi:hypothetical protein
MNRAGLSSIVLVMVALGGTGAYAQTVECQSLIGADPMRQVRTVEANLNCSSDFISHLVSDPRNHLKAFFTLVNYPAAAHAVVQAVYEEQPMGRIRFYPAINN